MSNDGRQSTRFRCGRAGVERLAWLLGLDRVARELRPTAAVWDREHGDVVIGPIDAPIAILRISRADPHRPSFATSDGLRISHHGESVPDDIGEVVRTEAPGRMAGIMLEDLAHELALDPDARFFALEPVLTTGNSGTLPWMAWRPLETCDDFWAEDEIARRGFELALDPSRAFVYIAHGDSECLCVNPRSPAALVQVVDYPWSDRRKPVPGRAGGVPQDTSGYEVLTTDLDEHDVITGNSAKLHALLEHLLASNPRHRPALFSNTCVPIVTGQEVESVVRRYGDRSEAGIQYLCLSDHRLNDAFRGLLRNRRLEAEAVAGPPEPDAISLVGFADNPGTREIMALLAQAGIRVNARVVPDVDEHTVARLPMSSLVVYQANRVWEPHYEHVRAGSRTPGITLPAPCGFQGTRAWMAAVGRELGREAEALAAWTEVAAELESRWEQARMRVAGRSIGIVLRPQDVAILEDPSRTWGIPFAAFLEEAGFELEFLLRAKDKDTARQCALAVQGALTDPGRHGIRAFDTFDRLRERLRDSTCDAFMGMQVFDWRLTEAGKNRVSLQQFEAGLEGAVRTVERLAVTCETPFYRRYGRYLARTSDGLSMLPDPEVGT